MVGFKVGVLVNEQSIELDPQVFHVIQEKQIEAITATAEHVFVSDDMKIVNSRRLRTSHVRNASFDF